MKILKIKESEVDRTWNGPISLHRKIKATCIKKGYRKVQLNGVVYDISILGVGISGMSIAWLGDRLGEINSIGQFIKEVK